MSEDKTVITDILGDPSLRRRLGLRIGADIQIAPIGRATYHVTGSSQSWIVRLARDEAHLSLLKKEARIQHGLRGWVTLLIPDTCVVDGLEGVPALAIHRTIPGQPLTSELYDGLSREARCRLVTDLATFFAQTHRIPLPVACEWLDVPFEGAQTVAWLASTRGKPTWFSPEIAALMRPTLLPLLDATGKELFEDTVSRFDALDVHPEFLVFGHGDMHGYNMALDRDGLGARLAGVFDLGCAGIMDIHEDLFRLSLIDETLPDDVMQTYGRLTGWTRPLVRDRIAVYYRAFLFHLMVGASRPYLEHLHALIQRHVTYSQSKGICSLPVHPYLKNSSRA